MGISAVIITLNEENNIERCIDSILGVVDEIIVIDSYSEDQTINIAENKNAKVIQKKWLGYSETKNYGNHLAKYEYILSIDADECLSENLKKNLLHIKDTLNGTYSFNRITNYGTKWIKFCGWYPDKKVRLFPKKKAKWKGNYVHEVLHIDPLLKENYLSGDLLHYSFTNPADHLVKVDKYAQLKAQKLISENKKYSFLKSGIDYLKRFIVIYFIKLGFLEGSSGYSIAKHSARGKILLYKYYRECKKKKTKS